MSLIQKCEELKNRFLEELVVSAQSKQNLLDLKGKYLGKGGALSEILASLKSATPDEKKVLGQTSNILKEEILKAIDEKLAELEKKEVDEKLKKEWVDLGLRDSLVDRGLVSAGLHPVSIIQREIEDIFLTMGFEILDGPHIENEYYNFEALNIPADHPARDMTDTFWFTDMKHLLRTHTSTIQVHGLESKKPPFKFIAPGKVFRSERTDASHEMCFHQLEGMMIAEDISVSHLIYFMKTLLSEIFKKDVEVRLRPGFFPFVEPGFELDIRCLICGGKGCSVCKQVGWTELLPCGMVHPNVLQISGIDPTKYGGFAFGLGLDRLVMMKYGIEDIRHIHGGDLRFSSQFSMYQF